MTVLELFLFAGASCMLFLFYDLCMLPILQLDVPFSGLVETAPKLLLNSVFDYNSTISLGQILVRLLMASFQPLDFTVMSLLQPCI
jgi:hypothetical protein